MRDRPQQRRSLLVFSDDWGRHPSSCQHLVRCLLPRYEVHWVNTIGTRKPSWNFATLSRGLEKLRHWTRRGDVPRLEYTRFGGLSQWNRRGVTRTWSKQT